MEIELKPCPFCGGKPKLTEKRRGNYRREGDNYQGLCNRCKGRGPLVQDSPQVAAEAWNRRVTSHAPDADTSFLEAYDPNIRWAKQTVRVKLQQCQYTAVIETTVGGNCQGFEIFDSAISTAWEELPTRGRTDEPYLILTAPNGDTLECEDDEMRGEDWLGAMVVGVEIVRQLPDLARYEEYAERPADEKSDGPSD